MGGARDPQPDLVGRAPCALAALFCLYFLPLTVQASKPLSEVCGRRALTKKIFGGQAAKPGQWPWQAVLFYRNTFICGATLIDEYWVASAAHCFQMSVFPSDYWILLGYNQLSNPTNYSLKMTVNKVIVHPDYDRIHRMSRDMTLLQLHRPVKFNSHILPACLPDSSLMLPPYTSCWITGFGQITEDKNLSQQFQLQEAEVMLISNEQCAAEYMDPSGIDDPRWYQVKEDMLCAAEYRTGKSICRGDSGGPLVCPVQGIWYLMGVSSWSGPCTPPVAPSVFARMTYFQNWIQEKKQATPDPDISLAPPQENPPVVTALNSQSTVKPQIFIVLLSSQIFLLKLILLRNL